MTKKTLLTLTAFLLMAGCLYAQPGQKMKERKFVYMTTAGFSAGVGQLNFEEGTRSIANHIPVFDIHQLIAYQFNPYVFTGIGVGLDIWKHTAFIPIYANVSVNFIDRKITPHWYLNVGYAFKWYISSKPEDITYVIHGSRTGLHGETGLGINIKINDKVSILVVGDYKLQDSHMRYSVNNPHEDKTTNRETHMLYHFAGVKFSVLY